MSAGFNVTLRNAMLNLITAAADAGAGDALLRVYDDGTVGRPATGAAVTDQVLLVESDMATPFAAGAAAGVLTVTLPPSATILASGFATWFRVVDSTGGFVMDGDVGVEMIINFPDLVLGEPFDVTSFAVTAGNV